MATNMLVDQFEKINRERGTAKEFIDAHTQKNAAKKERRIRAWKNRAKLAGSILLAAETATHPVTHSAVRAVVEAVAPSDDKASTVTYTVQPGDRAESLGKKVEANVDGIAGNQDYRPFADDIQDQAGPDNVLDRGEKVQLPKGADLDPNEPGVQLDHK